MTVGRTMTPEPAGKQRTLRLLAVGDDGAFRDLSRYAEADGALVERARDASGALRALQSGAWDLVIVGLDHDPDDQLNWWTDVLRRLPRRPRLVALVPTTSIGLALRAAQLGVFEVLPLAL